MRGWGSLDILIRKRAFYWIFHIDVFFHSDYPVTALRKNPLNPKAPMKPLYWTRIIAPSADLQDSSNPALWTEIDELSTDTLDEFSELFSRQIVTRKPSAVKKVEQKAKIEAIKLLDSKRSQNVGILAQSLHIDFQEIENAIYNFDTSVVSLEALQQIYEAVSKNIIVTITITIAILICGFLSTSHHFRTSWIKWKFYRTLIIFLKFRFFTNQFINRTVVRVSVESSNDKTVFLAFIIFNVTRMYECYFKTPYIPKRR